MYLFYNHNPIYHTILPLVFHDFDINLYILKSVSTKKIDQIF